MWHLMVVVKLSFSIQIKLFQSTRLSSIKRIISGINKYLMIQVKNYLEFHLHRYNVVLMIAMLFLSFSFYVLLTFQHAHKGLGQKTVLLVQKTVAVPSVVLYFHNLLFVFFLFPTPNSL